MKNTTDFGKRGYIRPTKDRPAGPQRELLQSKGVTIIYEEGKGETLENAIKHMRRGSVLYVPTFDRLSAHRRVLKQIIADVHERGAIIIEAKTGRRSDRAKDIAEMIFEAIDINNRRPLSTAEARRRGLLGGAPKKKLLSKRQDRMIWKDVVNYPDIADVVTAWSGDISVRTAFRWWGKRGTAIGRKKRARPGGLEARKRKVKR